MNVSGSTVDFGLAFLAALAGSGGIYFCNVEGQALRNLVVVVQASNVLFK